MREEAHRAGVAVNADVYPKQLLQSWATNADSAMSLSDGDFSK